MTRWRLLAMLGAWGVLVASLWVSSARPAALVLGGVVAVLGVALFVVVDLATDIGRIGWTRPSRPPSPADGQDRTIEAFRRQARGAVWTGSTQLNDTLVELVDDRLLAHHRIDRGSHPAAADAALTPTLRRLVAGRRLPVTSVRTLQHVLTDIEAL